jgi:hypothetical protein
MLAIEVELNGQRLTVAGANDLSVLTAHVSAVGLLGEETVEFRPTKGGPNDVKLHVSGLTSRAGSRQAHIEWIPNVALKLGDAVTFRVVEVQKAAPPVESKRTPTTAELAAAAAEEKRKRRGLTARSRPTRRKRRAAKRGR